MWWIIGISVVVALFIFWIGWELFHAPLIPDLFDGFSLDEED